MPRTNPKYALEIATQPNVDAAYQREVNDKMRVIANALDSGSSSTSTSSGSISGSQLILAAPGVLAIQSSVAPLVSLAGDVTPTEIVAYLKQASVGADLKGTQAGHSRFAAADQKTRPQPACLL